MKIGNRKEWQNEVVRLENAFSELNDLLLEHLDDLFTEKTEAIEIAISLVRRELKAAEIQLDICIKNDEGFLYE